MTVQTVWLVNIFGLGYGVGDINYAGNPLWYRTNYNEISVPIEGSSVAIIQSCTAIQSMLIFIGAIYCVQALKRSKWYAFFATVPVIYVLNLLRNLGIIYMMDVLGWSYDFSHNTVGKAGSFLALIVLAFITFKLLPELLDNFWGILDLRDRGKKKEEEEKGDVGKEELEEVEHEEVVEEKGEGEVKEESMDEKEVHEVEGDEEIGGEEEVEKETEEEIEEG